MEPIDRLTSYLDGELEPDEHAAVEAALAGDPALRAQVEALRHVDAQLEALPPTELPPGARERLDERLRPALQDTTIPPVVAGAPTTSATVGVPDQLAERRARRTLPLALGGVAAGLAVVAVSIVGLDQVGLLDRADDEAASLALDSEERATEDDAMGLQSLPEAADEAAMPLPDLPVTRDDGRRISSDDLDLALEDAVLREVAATGLAGAEAAEVAAAAQARLLDPAIAEVVRRCVTELLEDDQAAIPVLVEVLEVDDVPALQVGLVTTDPSTGAWTRTEVWTLEQANCQVLRFAQS